MRLRTATITTITMLVAGAMAACGTSAPPTNGGSTLGSAVATPLPTTTPPPNQHATAPSPGTPPSNQGYMNCLGDPATTLDYCRQFDPDPSPTATPTPVVPSAGPAKHFTGRVRLLKGPFDLSIGNGQLTGCTGGTGSYSDVGGTTALVVTSGGVTVGRAALGSGTMNGSECDFNLDFGTFPQQTTYVTAFSSGNHGTLTWTLTEMQGKNYLFAIVLGGTS